MRFDKSAHDYLEQCLAIYTARGSRPGMAVAYNNLGWWALTQGNTTLSRAYYEQSLPLGLAVGWQRHAAMCLYNLGQVAKSRHDYPAARDYFEQSLAMQQSEDNPEGIADCFEGFGGLAYEEAEYASAETYNAQALSLARALQSPERIARVLAQVAANSVKLGQLDAAAQALVEGLTIARDIDANPIKELHISAAALLWLALDKPLMAAPWLGLLVSRSLPGTDLYESITNTLVPELRQRIPADHAARMAQGRSLDLNETVAHLLRELDQGSVQAALKTVRKKGADRDSEREPQ